MTLPRLRDYYVRASCMELLAYGELRYSALCQYDSALEQCQCHTARDAAYSHFRELLSQVTRTSILSDRPRFAESPASNYSYHPVFLTFVAPTCIEEYQVYTVLIHPLS
jgi:hypothetical protein